MSKGVLDVENRRGDPSIHANIDRRSLILHPSSRVRLRTSRLLIFSLAAAVTFFNFVTIHKFSFVYGTQSLTTIEFCVLESTRFNVKNFFVDRWKTKNVTEMFQIWTMHDASENVDVYSHFLPMTHTSAFICISSLSLKSWNYMLITWNLSMKWLSIVNLINLNRTFRTHF